MINVKEESDGSLTIDWDKNDPVESTIEYIGLKRILFGQFKNN
jgi:hypothetical protein